MYFGLYDTGAANNPYKNDHGLAGIVSKFGIAQATAITAGYASYPFDTVRRRLQMQSEKPQAEWHYQVMLYATNCHVHLMSGLLSHFFILDREHVSLPALFCT